MVKNRKAFTMVELLLIIAILGILSLVVYVAVNPAKRLSDSRNSHRSTDIQNIFTAVKTYVVDNQGSYPTGLTVGMSEAQLGTATTGAAITTGGCVVTTSSALDLTAPLANYLKTIPVDPSGTAALTKYAIGVDANGIVTVKACGAENATLSVSQ